MTYTASPPARVAPTAEPAPRAPERATHRPDGSPRRAPGWRFWAGLGLLALLGMAVRLIILASPLGELDGDEAVIGLMARHIAFFGDRPVFYYNQHYVGSLEAFSAAPLFLLFDSSTLLLKLVPTAYSLGFLVFTALIARRLFGTGPALVTAAYLALPPAMWAVWSTKARGGYASELFLGSVLLWLTLRLAEGADPAGQPDDTPAHRQRHTVPGDSVAASRGDAPAIGTRRARSTTHLFGGVTWLTWGVVAGLALWTHLLAVVYLVPAAAYLALAYRPRLRENWRAAAGATLLATLGGLLGAAPLLAYNLANDFATITALLRPADLPYDPLDQIYRFFRVGLPVLAGLGQPTTSATMFDHDWLLRPAGRAWVAVALLAGLAAVLALHLSAVRRLVRGGGTVKETGPALLIFLAVSVPLVVALTRFGFFVSEPRYALALYSALPLVAAALWRLPRPARALAVAGLLALNGWSILSTDLRLWQPEETVGSTATTRAALMEYLVARDIHQMYTDYWIGYPIMFESRETVLAYIVASGFNRYIPHADNVQRTPNAAWVFMPDSVAEAEFTRRLTEIGGSATCAPVAVYHVCTDVQPLDALRP